MQDLYLQSSVFIAIKTINAALNAFIKLVGCTLSYKFLTLGFGMIIQWKSILSNKEVSSFEVLNILTFKRSVRSSFSFMSIMLDICKLHSDNHKHSASGCLLPVNLKGIRV